MNQSATNQALLLQIATLEARASLNESAVALLPGALARTSPREAEVVLKAFNVLSKQSLQNMSIVPNSDGDARAAITVNAFSDALTQRGAI